MLRSVRSQISIECGSGITDHRSQAGHGQRLSFGQNPPTSSSSFIRINEGGEGRQGGVLYSSTRQNKTAAAEKIKARHRRIQQPLGRVQEAARLTRRGCVRRERGRPETERMRNEGDDDRTSGQVLGEQRWTVRGRDRGHAWLANREASRRGTFALASSPIYPRMDKFPQ